MVFIILCILSVIFIFLIATTLISMRATWIYETKKKPLNHQFRVIQSSFKELVLPLYTDDIIDVTTKQRIISIVSNFFVFQTLNERNIERLLITVESCRSVFNQCMTAHAQYPDQFPPVLEKFINAIPTGARDFDADFYNTTLPSAIEIFNASVQKLTKTSLLDKLDLNEEEEEEEYDIFQEQARREKQKQLLEKNAANRQIKKEQQHSRHS